MSKWLDESHYVSNSLADAQNTLGSEIWNLEHVFGSESGVISNLRYAAALIENAKLSVESSRNLVLNEMLASSEESFASVTKLVVGIVDGKVKIQV